MSARRELVRKIGEKAHKLGLTPHSSKKGGRESREAVHIDGRPLTAAESGQRDSILRRMREDGCDRVVEDAACTWFNRFTALRFMEVNGYLPAKAGVLSSNDTDRTQPDMVREPLAVGWDVDERLVSELQANRDTELLFRYLLLRLCGSLHRALPYLFEPDGDDLELLLPEKLLGTDDLVRRLTDTEALPESVWRRVEIVGWLYQYYMTEEKDRVIKAKKKYASAQIPAATQLFTPEWIVRYMVQNSLGRYWLESHPEDGELLRGWEFYLERPRPEGDLERQYAPRRTGPELKPEQLKCFDPAMGSGHILVYLFDVLFEIYRRRGYAEHRIPRLILEHNLHGLDIDDRACRLASFSVVMKALQYDRRFLERIEREGLSLRLASIQETDRLDDRDIGYLAGERGGMHFQATKRFVERFRNAKTHGSLIQPGEYDKCFLEQRLQQIQDNPAERAVDERSGRKWAELLPDLLRQADLLNASYPVIVTNPPFMGSANMNDRLTGFLKNHYPETKSDLFSAFLEMCLSRATPNGQLGFMTPFVWMFIAAYEPLRKRILGEATISSLIQLEYSAFEDATVPICAFTLSNGKVGASGEYVKLSDFAGAHMQPVKAREAVRDPSVGYRYSAQAETFGKVPGNLIVYWLDLKALRLFDGPRLAGLIATREGMTTADNDKFLREWHEVSSSRIGFGIRNNEEAARSGKRWFPYLKGGAYRKWYGNSTKVVDWENDGAAIRSNVDPDTGRIRSHNYNGDFGFREGITFPTVSSGKFGARYAPGGFMFDAKGAMGFFRDESDLYVTLALLNTAVSQYYLRALAPTLDFKLNKIMAVPALIPDRREPIVSLCKQCIDIAKRDWDFYERSWQFSTHPLLAFRTDSGRVEDAFAAWASFKRRERELLKESEERLNAIFIDHYGLGHAVSPTVGDDELTIADADRKKDIESFLSYAAGCIFGRYSLDAAGLVYAGGVFDPERCRTFPAVRDNIVPILPSGHGEEDDDIASRFIGFVEAAFGADRLAENVEYIAESLGKKDGESARAAIGSYFAASFFRDHVLAYRKKPIYWLFSSGKHKAFACLVYMHRYDRTTLSTIRNDYVQRRLLRLEEERKSLDEAISGDGTAEQRSIAGKKRKELGLKLDELRAYDGQLRRMADMRLELDPDDGVAVNMGKLGELLAKAEPYKGPDFAKNR